MTEGKTLIEKEIENPEKEEKFSVWRKDMKKRGKKVLKSHYLLLLIVLVISVFFGNEYNMAGNIFTLSDLTGTSSVTEQEGNGKVVNSASWDNKSSTDVIFELISSGAKKGSKMSERIEQYKVENDNSRVLARSRGALASIVNAVSSGGLYVKVFSALTNITNSKSAGKVLFIILGLFLYIWIWIFLKNVYKIVVRRIYLEARTYKRVPFLHGIRFIRVRRWGRAAAGLLLTEVFMFLWMFTIVGYFIKFFSYMMVPYIISENPDIKPREAITLSRKMMNGHKWECFRILFTFIGWYILSAITLGLVELFWFGPYKQAVMCEYYARLRQQAKEKGIEGADRLDDTYLFENPGQDQLEEVYKDIREKAKGIDSEAIELKGAKKFCAEYMGVWLGSVESKRVYQGHENERNRIRAGLDAVNGLIYPQRLDPLDYQARKGFSFKFSYLRCYTVWVMVFMFIFFAFLGWCWEVSLHLVNEGTFVNRGALHGPWLPIYGTGGVIIILALSKLRTKPVIEFVAAIVLSGIVEYFTSLAMESAHGMRWWDYTGYYLNLDGRICAEGLITFGIIGMLVVYLVAPIMDSLLSKVPTKVLVPVVTVLLVAFLGDVVYSHFYPNTGEGITDYDAYEQSSMVPQTQHQLYTGGSAGQGLMNE